MKIFTFFNLILCLLIFNVSEAQLSGTYSIGYGAGDDYNTLFQALNDLEANGASGPVIFELSADYNSGAESYPIFIQEFPGASSANTLTVKPAEGTTHVIEKDLLSPGTAVFAFIDAGHVILDGSNNGTDTRDLTIISSGDDAETGAVALYTNSTSGTDITIKNCILKAGSKEFETAGIYSDYFTDVLIQNNKISNARIGIITFGDNVSVLNNEIGSDVESEYLHYGISTQYGSNITVSGNKIYNIIDNQDFDAVRAISVNDVTGDMIISGNYIDSVIHTGSNVVQAVSIKDCIPDSMLIGNNRISNIASDSYSDNYPGAIAIDCPSMTSGMHILYNSVYMPENNQYGTGLGGSGVFAGGILIGNGTGISLKNNVIVNELGIRDGASGVVLGASILIDNDNNPFAENDNNLFYVGGDYTVAILAATSSLNTYDLSEWRTWTGGGIHSFFEEPLFSSANLLQLQACSPAVAHAVNIPSITDDIEGIERDPAYPSMGAYEYNKIQASNLVQEFPAKAEGSAMLSWQQGTGCKSAVFMKEGNFVSDPPIPETGVTYSSDLTFGNGDQIGSTGWFCVGNDASSVSNITINATNGLEYTVMVCEYYGNGGYEIYLTNTSVNNPILVTADNSGAVKTVKDINFSVYPNPSCGNVFIEISPEVIHDTGYELKITDITGKEIQSIQNIRDQKLELNLSNLNKGIYFIQIQSENMHHSEKLIIK